MVDPNKRDRRDDINEPDENRDPISGQPGAHPVGTGIGAAGVGAVGAVVGGVIGGPVGAVVGSAVGAVAGGLIGKGAAESVDPTVEDTYWREQHNSRPYYEKGRTYEDYQPAYRTGYEGYSRYGAAGRTFDDAEPDLRKDYDTHRTTQGKSKGFTWDKAKYAARDAWDRVDNTVRGNNDHDTYWRQNYASRPYYEKGRTYEDYAPAYRFGHDSYSRYGSSGRTFAQVEPDLRRDYESRQGGAGLAWDKAKHAVQDAWDRATNAVTDRDRNVNTTAGQNAQQVNLYEERLVADKNRVKTGEVNVGKHVETETARVDVPVERERVVIDRTTPSGAGTPVDPGSVDFQEGEVARVEVYEEQADIHKEAVVREEVRIRKEVEQKTVQAEEKIRREELDVDSQGQNIVDRTGRTDRTGRSGRTDRTDRRS